MFSFRDLSANEYFLILHLHNSGSCKGGKSHHAWLTCNLQPSGGQLQAVGHNSINNGEYIEANISDLVNGVYFVEIVTGKQKLVKKFIKE